jgi:cobalamin-dependent methionine synthase I
MEGDYHDLGAQAARAVLELEGWKVYYLGPNVPVEDFAAVQQAQVADLVCISFSTKNTLPDVQRAVRVLGEFYRPGAPYALALGGGLEGVSAEKLGKSPFDAISFSRSAAEFQEWLGSLSRPMGSGQPLRVA